MQKTLALLVTSVMVASLLLTGCGSSSGTLSSGASATSTSSPGTDNKNADTKAVPSSGQKVKVVVWGLDPMAVGSGNRDIVDAFNKSHLNIQLLPQMTPGSSGYDTQDLSKLTAAIAAGTPPDVIWLNAPFIMEVASSGSLLNIFL